MGNKKERFKTVKKYSKKGFNLWRWGIKEGFDYAYDSRRVNYKYGATFVLDTYRRLQHQIQIITTGSVNDDEIALMKSDFNQVRKCWDFTKDKEDILKKRYLSNVKKKSRMLIVVSIAIVLWLLSVHHITFLGLFFSLFMTMLILRLILDIKIETYRHLVISTHQFSVFTFLKWH